MKIAAYLAAQARVREHKPAVVCGEARLTFGQLHAQSDSVAAYLRRSGIVVGDRIAICLPNCCEFLTVFFAILKCGGIAMPVNMRLSPDEIAAIFQDADPAAVFFGEAERQTVSGLPTNEGIRRFFVGEEDGTDDASFATMTRCPGEAIDVPAEYDDCMISYTSGTTGRPKGVVTTQANYIVANGYLNALYWGVGEDDRILVTTPLAHRTAFARVGNMFVLGATLHVLPRFGIAEATRVIKEERISLLSIVPTVGRMLLPSIESSPDAFASLRVLVATGEAFPQEIKRRMLKALPDLKIFSFFAMTEAGSLAMLKPDEQLTHGGSVGRVTPGVELRLVTSAGPDAAAGEAGEIWVRCGLPGQYLLFRTYFQQPDATRDAFEDGWFKTGDIGRLDADGYLHIVDRKKDMVLSGGYNIYSKEVESVLMEHAGVSDAAVIGVPDSIYGEAVAAFIEPAEGVDVTQEALVAWCAKRMAGYKKPKFVIFSSGLPKNSMGKVMKNELRARFRELSNGKPG